MILKPPTTSNLNARGTAQASSEKSHHTQLLLLFFPLGFFQSSCLSPFTHSISGSRFLRLSTKQWSIGVDNTAFLFIRTRCHDTPFAMKSTVFKLATWSSCVTTICAQTLVSSLETRPELVLFNDYIQSIPTLLNTLTNITNYTLLAPSDTAMTRWLNETSPSPTQDEIEATLNYHILHGGYSLGSFSTVPQFASSYLSNSSFTNVTGGAVVELVEDGGNPVVVSALRVQSSITKGVSSL